MGRVGTSTTLARAIPATVLTKDQRAAVLRYRAAARELADLDQRRLALADDLCRVVAQLRLSGMDSARSMALLGIRTRGRYITALTNGRALLDTEAGAGADGPLERS